MNENFKILTLDGGGSKGVYSLGILHEVEAKLKAPLSNYFDYFYGTSTGAIIAAALADGKSVKSVKSMYLEKIPYVMKSISKSRRTQRLRQVLEDEFADKKINALKKPLAIVATSLDERKSKIFKSSASFAHGRKNTFEPAWGFSVAKCLMASCAATPFFDKVILEDESKGICFSLMDGGFAANNPTLFALIDAIKSYGKTYAQIKVLNVGTGQFPFRITPQVLLSFAPHMLSRDLITEILDISSNTIADVMKYLLDDVRMLRISDAFTQPSMATNLLESDMRRLMKLYDQGKVSFGKKEKEFDDLFASN